MDNNSSMTRKIDSTGSIRGDDGATRKKYKKHRRPSFVAGRIATMVLGAFFTLVLILLITGIIVGSVFAVYIENNLIDEDYDIVGLETNLDQTTKIFYFDEMGERHELDDQRLYGEENRSWISVSQMPTNLKDAFIAIEDKRFYEHNGMDFKRTTGAVLEFLRGNSSYGGSTITQQLIKNFSGENDATIQRKIKEIFRAISLTKKRSKDEVLEMYLNTINLSNGCYGVQAAANYLFNKDVSELTLVECAALAAIPKSPYKYNPKNHPEENLERRNTVLDEMRKNGWITKEEFDEAINTELVLNINKDIVAATGATVYSYFTDALIEQIIADLNREYGYPREVATNIIFGGGLEIHSTMDPRIQNIMEEVFADPDTFVHVDGIQPESAMVVMDPYTGDIKGLVGGRGEKTLSRGQNRATMSKRQIGSAIKPLSVYSPAIDLGYVDYATVIDDTPLKYNEETEEYWPRNAGRDYRGKTTVNYGIKQSLNTTAVKVLDMITPEYSYNFMTEKLGITSLEKSDIDYSPLALGGLTYGLTVTEVTAAYSIFPNEGIYSAPRLYTVIYDNNGNILLENQLNQQVAISKSTSQIMTKCLEDVLTSGTGGALTLKNSIDVAGKTGSTNDDKDIYFVGYTPYYVGGCWFGYDIPKTLSKKLTSPNQALVAWDKTMTRIHEEIINESKTGGEKLREFSDSELVEAEFCCDSGHVPTILCEAFDPRGSRVQKGWFKKGSEPTQKCETHILVNFDGDTSAVANPFCPEHNIKQFALIRTEGREYIKDIIIGDAQYSYMQVPEGYISSDDATLPYYSELLPDETFAGRTKDVTYPFNRGCAVHGPKLEEEPEEDIPDDTGEKSEDSTESEDVTDGSEDSENDEQNDSNDSTDPEDEEQDNSSVPVINESGVGGADSRDNADRTEESAA